MGSQLSQRKRKTQKFFRGDEKGGPRDEWTKVLNHGLEDTRCQQIPGKKKRTKLIGRQREKIRLGGGGKKPRPPERGQPNYNLEKPPWKGGGGGGDRNREGLRGGFRRTKRGVACVQRERGAVSPKEKRMKQRFWGRKKTKDKLQRHGEKKSNSPRSKKKKSPYWGKEKPIERKRTMRKRSLLSGDSFRKLVHF